MKHTTTLWDLEDDPSGNAQHILEHGLTKEEVEEVLDRPLSIDTSRSSGRSIAFGETSTGRLIVVIFEEIDEDTVRPVTAYEVEDEG